MAYTLNSTIDRSENSRQPSAPFQADEIDITADASYPANGYDLSADLPEVTAVLGIFVPDYDGASLRWLKVVQHDSKPKVQIYADANGSPGAQESAGGDMSGHANVKLQFLWR